MPLKRQESELEQLRRQRGLLRKALRRLKRAEGWKAAGEAVDEKCLSLEHQLREALREEEQKRDRLSVEKALARPTHFPVAALKNLQ